jgi:hypothetical protein
MAQNDKETWVKVHRVLENQLEKRSKISVIKTLLW